MARNETDSGLVFKGKAQHKTPSSQSNHWRADLMHGLLKKRSYPYPLISRSAI